MLLPIGHGLSIEVEITRPIHRCPIYTMDNGIELPEESLQVGIFLSSIIVISGQKNGKNYIITVEVSGKGIDIVAIKGKNKFRISCFR